jgi:hypothetical protein
MGSFDCVGVRFANANSAQDDIIGRGRRGRGGRRKSKTPLVRRARKLQALSPDFGEGWESGYDAAWFAILSRTGREARTGNQNSPALQRWDIVRNPNTRRALVRAER